MNQFDKPWEAMRSKNQNMLGVELSGLRDKEKKREAGEWVDCACGCGQRLQTYKAGKHQKIYFSESCRVKVHTARRKEKLDAEAKTSRPKKGDKARKRNEAAESANAAAAALMGAWKR